MFWKPGMTGRITGITSGRSGGGNLQVARQSWSSLKTVSGLKRVRLRSRAIVGLILARERPKYDNPGLFGGIASNSTVRLRDGRD